MNYGTLFLIPNTLGGSELSSVIPGEVINVINTIDNYVVENIKSAVRFLKLADIQIPVQEINFYVLNKDTDDKELSDFLKPLLKGRNVGIISQAGCPCIADPGAKFVSLAHQKGVRVVPLVGPSSITLALMASGFSGQEFCFNGYLPIDKKKREKNILTLERRVQSSGKTQIFIEAPHRNDTLLGEIIRLCEDETKLCVAVNLTMQDEMIITRKIADWKKNKPVIGKNPAIFLMGI